MEGNTERHKDGKFVKGFTPNPTGKPKGAISKTAKYIRDFLAEVMVDNLPRLQEDLDKMRPKDRWATLRGLSDKFLPNLTHTDIEANVNGQVKFIVEYVDTPTLTTSEQNLIEADDVQFEDLSFPKDQVQVQNGIEPKPDDE